MAFEKRFIPIFAVVITVYGFVYAFNFLTTTTAGVLIPSRDSTWDMILFIPGLADIDNLYLIFGTIPLSFVALLLSGIGAGFFILLNRLWMRSRAQSIDGIEPKRSLTGIVSRAIVTGMFSFSFGEVFVQYAGEFSLPIFSNPDWSPSVAAASFDFFLTRTLHLALVFLPFALLIFIPTWILNDFVVITRRKDVKSGEYSDPVKVGQWVSGLLSGFSLFAFPLAYLNRFIVIPYERFGLIAVVERLPLILWAMINVLIVFLAFVFPVIIVYEAGKSRFASYFYKVAKRLKVKDLASMPGDSPVPMDEEKSSSIDENGEWVGPDTA